MSKLPTLDKILDEIDGAFSGDVYLNTKTGATYTMSPDNGYDVDEEIEAEDEAMLQEIEASGDWVALPSMRDFDEYRIMEAFCESLPDGGVRDRLSDAIHGRGAFRRFKDVLHRTNSQDQWYAFRNERLKKEIAEWLEMKEIPYQQ